MSAVGGPIESISIAGRIFPVVGDADATIDLGGSTVEYQPNGNGTSRRILTAKPWKVSGISVEIDHNRADQQFLQANSNGIDDKAITVTLASGHTYQGTGGISGDLAFSSMNTKCDLELSGPGALELQ